MDSPKPVIGLWTALAITGGVTLFILYQRKQAADVAAQNNAARDNALAQQAALANAPNLPVPIVTPLPAASTAPAGAVVVPFSQTPADQQASIAAAQQAALAAAQPIVSQAIPSSQPAQVAPVVVGPVTDQFGPSQNATLNPTPVNGVVAPDPGITQTQTAPTVLNQVQNVVDALNPFGN